MSHQFVNIQEVRDNPTYPWNLNSLSSNKQLTVKDINTLKLPNSILKWEWYLISQSIDIREVRNNPDQPWNLYWLSKNSQLTVRDIENLRLPNSEDDWKWFSISWNIDIQEVINNPNQHWIKAALRNNRGCNNKILEFLNAGLLKHLQKNIGIFKYRTDIAIKCE